VWIHVSSVGEFEQARPLITELARARPDIPIALTFSSPSGFRFARRREHVGGESNIAFLDYLPEDTSKNMRLCFECLSPRLLILVKFDIWPNLVWTAHDRGVPIVLVDATLSRSSRRLSRLGRSFYRSIYAAITRIVAISELDAERFRSSVPQHARITVAGDTRFDRVMERWNEREATSLAYDPLGRHVVIAGSTWPADETRLLPALAGILANDAGVCAIIAPHEPEPDRVAALVRWTGQNGFSVHTVTGGGPPGARVAIIDTVGVLAEAYRLGTIAYVGGGFSTGVHSVLEPAIAGLPVLFGPVNANSLEAAELIAHGGAFCVRTAHELQEQIHRLLGNTSTLTDAAVAAQKYVHARTGATSKCMEAIAEFL